MELNSHASLLAIRILPIDHAFTLSNLMPTWPRHLSRQSFDPRFRKGMKLSRWIRNRRELNDRDYADAFLVLTAG